MTLTIKIEKYLISYNVKKCLYIKEIFILLISFLHLKNNTKLV
jgi:hypothetical protein